MTGRDIQKHQFISTGLAVTTGQLDRISRIAKSDEIHTLHHAPLGDIKTGN